MYVCTTPKPYLNVQLTHRSQQTSNLVKTINRSKGHVHQESNIDSGENLRKKFHFFETKCHPQIVGDLVARLWSMEEAVSLEVQTEFNLGILLGIS
jgi:hypothetical protein